MYLLLLVFKSVVMNQKNKKKYIFIWHILDNGSFKKQKNTYLQMYIY